ncbi:23S rRNA (guanosine(2251)-2'-O)-methyltransferase RlmB [Hymenobacter chitinivorans]|uniref:23S rRNA (Guanosine2251-2'-O)-methyltransferase n=1 Tax=Hymenobacter chitinivorans DSM 11115 TaxID=1121954 RepID=A0A2M9BA81_9BACT|nr:23S rRNA (guanosine(2251)-2'-O)-methyltransferase RlmB [Hymenobacter chitinivorans]PJJ54849.1 23S rRNA (guanosine2251-2'-O)-methyltransferase [Hymenobacter chitinivorans DSM 11115]
MEKRNDDRPERPLNERRTYYNSENRPVSREERGGPDRRESRGGGEGRDSRGGDSRSSGDFKPRYPHKPAADRSIDMLFGLRPILEALTAGRTLEKIFLLRGTKNSVTQEITELAKAANVPMSLVPIEKLNDLTRKNHQGAVAFVSPIDYQPLDSILAGLYEEGKTPLLLLLDRITDVRNFGSIARNAECMGVHAIVVPSRGAAQINGDALKTSAGALNLIPVCREPNLKETITFLQQSGVTIIACTEKSDASLEAETVDMTGPVAVLMGSEEDGISPEYLKLADHKLRIPMAGQIGSLNVSVASGIMLFEVLRQRLKSGQ